MQAVGEDELSLLALAARTGSKNLFHAVLSVLDAELDDDEVRDGNTKCTMWPLREK